MYCKFDKKEKDIFICKNCGKKVGPFEGLSADRLFFLCNIQGEVVTLPPSLEKKLSIEIKEKEEVMKKGGPGTELHNMLDKLGFRLDPKDLSCGCKSMIDKMNRWGAEGCKKENNRKEILEHLNKQKHLTPLGGKLKAGALAIKHGLPLTVEGLLDEAIKKADAKK